MRLRRWLRHQAGRSILVATLALGVACVAGSSCASEPPADVPCDTHQDCPGYQECVLLVCQESQPLEIVTESLPGAQIEEAYQAEVLAAGGVGSYAWSLQNAPAWLSMDAGSGALSGTPPDAGQVSVTVAVTDEKDQQATRDYTITVEGCQMGATLPCHVVGGGVCWVGEHVCQTSGAFGACEPLSYSLDPDHCGSDCSPCNATVGDLCEDGLCVCGAGGAGCVSPEQCCDEVCSDVSSDATNCGECGVDCADTAPAHTVPECVMSLCTNSTCELGWADCNSDMADGCEEALNTTAFCGSCEVSCDPLPNVATRTCDDPGTGYECSFACTSGHYDCNGDPADGCESTDSTCGVCSCTCAPDALGNSVCNGDTAWQDCSQPGCMRACECNSTCSGLINCQPGCICM